MQVCFFKQCNSKLHLFWMCLYSSLYCHFLRHCSCFKSNSWLHIILLWHWSLQPTQTFMHIRQYNTVLFDSSISSTSQNLCNKCVAPPCHGYGHDLLINQTVNWDAPKFILNWLHPICGNLHDFIFSCIVVPRRVF